MGNNQQNINMFTAYALSYPQTINYTFIIKDTSRLNLKEMITVLTPSLCAHYRLNLYYHANYH
jgi:hypothetical protein